MVIIICSDRMLRVDGAGLPVQHVSPPQDVPTTPLASSNNNNVKKQLDESNEKLKRAEELLAAVIQANEEEKSQSEQRIKALEQQVSEQTEQQLQDLQLVDSSRTPQRRPFSFSEQGLEQTWKIQKGDIEVTDKELGAGGWSKVKLARFRGLEVAAKEMHNIILTPYNNGLFVREMNMAASVRHPNLVQFIGACMDGSPIILTELMGKSLRDLLQDQKKLSMKHVSSICEDIAKALNYLHLMKPNAIIHRDVSSANVLLEELAQNRWRAKLSDYGSANFVQLVTTIAPGSPAYAAPESLNTALQSPKMDVFSYGVLMIEVFTRKFPTPDIREQQIRDITSEYASLVPLIRQCISAEPKDRPDMSVVLYTLLYA